MSNPKRSYSFLTVELAPFGNIEIDGDKYPQDLSYSVSTVYCETPEEKWNPSPDIHLEAKTLQKLPKTDMTS
ncbi:Deoxyuridine 5'-triphosphate nucleotidohydrolase [Armadillidium vulgare]|nr:Deoxyuridine 5'-triphosphate nucleotidohydrolase [Armadillidium vulgare]